MNTYKKWLIKVLVSVFLLLGIASIFGKYVIINPVFNINNFKLSESTDTLVIGASHSACTFNAKHFKNTLNISNNGEPVFLTYYKIKALLKNNPQVKTLIMAYSPLHISRSQDFNLFDTNATSREKMLDYFVFLDDDGRDYFKIYNPDYLLASAKYDYGLPLSYMDDLKLIVNYYRNKIDYTSYSFWGGYTGFKGNHLDKTTTDKIIQLHFVNNDVLVGLSNIAIEHIKKIAELAGKNDIKIILINTPMHESLRSRIPEFYTRKFKEVVTDILANNPAVSFQDFSDVKLSDDYFLDGDHLNLTGGRYFSAYYAKKINKHTSVKVK